MPVVIRARGIELAKQKLGMIGKEDILELAFKLLELVREVHLTRQSKKRTLLLD